MNKFDFDSELLLEPNEIFLLGYDYTAINNYTHFYQGAIRHRQNWK